MSITLKGIVDSIEVDDYSEDAACGHQIIVSGCQDNLTRYCTFNMLRKIKRKGREHPTDNQIKTHLIVSTFLLTVA